MHLPEALFFQAGFSHARLSLFFAALVSRLAFWPGLSSHASACGKLLP